MEILVPGTFTYSGVVNSGATVYGSVPFTVSGNSCGQILADLNDYQASDGYYPVECDFVTLSSTGVVFFMNSVDQQIGNSLLIQTQSNAIGFTEEDLDYVFNTQGGLIIFLFLALTLLRQIRKFRQKRSPINPL